MALMAGLTVALSAKQQQATSSFPEAPATLLVNLELLGFLLKKKKKGKQVFFADRLYIKG